MARPAPAMAALSRLPVVVASVLLGALLAMLALARLPPLYESEAALLVELAQHAGESSSALSFDATDLLPLLEQRIRARAISAEVAARLTDTGLTASRGRLTPRSEMVPADSLPPALVEAGEETRARIMTVGLLAPGAQRASAATNEVTGLLLREAAEMRQGAGEQPAPADEEIERLARELEGRGTVLRSFLAERADALPDSLDARRIALATEEERLAEIARAEEALESPSPADEADGTAASEADAQRALVARQRAEAEARTAELRRSIVATPANAQNLTELRERFEAIRAEFDRITQQRVAAEASDMVALLSGSTRVSVLALAAPPGAPANLDRLLILVAGVGGGLLVGLGLTFFLNARDRSIRYPEEIATQLGLEPFAALPVLRSRRHTRGQRLGWTLVLLALVGIALWTVHSRIIPMDLLLGRLLEALRPASAPAG